MNGTSELQAADQLTAKFVKDTSKYWYKPHISREEGPNKQLHCIHLIQQ